MADISTGAVLHPGPFVYDIISAGTAHRARSIFDGHILGDQLDVRRCDRHFWDHTPIPETVRHYIRLAGFEGVLDCGYMMLDHALITSLVERWRPETHTFHLPVGETTVTLQDVEVLWGLPIDGPPVIGIDTTHSVQEWVNLCEELLGFSPLMSDFDGRRLKLGCLSRVLDAGLPPDASDVHCRQRARIYLLLLLGGHLLSDKSGNKVPLLYMPLLRDLETVGQYSWGSAILATLYRSLCSATSPYRSSIAGPLMLLQLWAWERIPTVRPDRVHPLEHYPGPYGARWNVQFDVHRVARHVVSIFRDQLTGLRAREFIWQPYSDDILASLPPYCTAGRRIWTSVTYLICWEVVEPHLSNRVMRQFGYHQPVPDLRLTENQQELHSLDRRGKGNQDWLTAHRAYVEVWTDRHSHVEDGVVAEDPTYPSDEYRQWYRERTVVYVSNPTRQLILPEGFQGDSARTQYLMDAMTQVYYMAETSLTQSDEQHANYFNAMKDFASMTLETVGESSRLAFRPSRVPQQIPQPTDPNRVERAPRNVHGGQHGGGRRRRFRSPEPTVQTGLDGRSQATEHQGTSTGPFGHSRSPVLMEAFTPNTDELHGSGEQHVGGTDAGQSTQALDQRLESQITQVDIVMPAQPRRTQRAHKPRGCGTHGKLGHH
ncbi:serine/threonine-protein phosphatase 7 long form homolog isoform X2 [Coffea arabica]|uniref:Serine/threonine-protein phosphatase 7 long form homolog isoform X2 n=1 Tax=Coffea arabica TaxID=13443 RepID=A0ABM4WSJ7_COFAR